MDLSFDIVSSRFIEPLSLASHSAPVYVLVFAWIVFSTSSAVEPVNRCLDVVICLLFGRRPMRFT